MNIIGKWKLKGINIPTENGPVFYTGADFPEEYVDIFNENKDMILEFCEDGTLNTIVEATGAYLEMAAAEGIAPREDGFIVVDAVKWEDRGGESSTTLRQRARFLMSRLTPLLRSMLPKTVAFGLTSAWLCTNVCEVRRLLPCAGYPFWQNGIELQIYNQVLAQKEGYKTELVL